MGTSSPLNPRRPLSHIIPRVLVAICLILALERLSTYFYFGTSPAAYLVPSFEHDDADIAQEAVKTLVNEKHPAKHAASGQSKAIIIASILDEDTSWVRDNFPDWELNIYVVDDDTAVLKVPKREGREAAVYLTYIIDNYAMLPDYMVFAHAQRYQWHNDDPLFDGVNPIRQLQLPHVAAQGYVPLRCAWKPGCPAEMQRGAAQAWDTLGVAEVFFKSFRRLFPRRRQPDVVGAACCAQFAVSRAAVRRRPLADYRRLRRWLWRANMPDGFSGRVFEYSWHVVFGRPPVSCPSAQDCYCRAFGLCHLKCPDDEHCLGRFKLLAWYQHEFPEGWPRNATVPGFPKDRWWEEFYPPDRWDGFEPRNGTLPPAEEESAQDSSP